MNVRLLSVVMVVLVWGGVSFGEGVSFNRDIRPLLVDRCFACHGPDAKERKGKLRLDVTGGKDGAYRTKDGVTVIKPGSIKDSELWYRIVTNDEEDVMPPPKSHKKRFSKAELALIKQWIEGGAGYEKFWAFEQARMPAKPVVKMKGWSEQPIDLHVLKRLESEGMKPSASADRRTLIRRVTIDLTGLPPTRDEVRAFLNDKRANAYELLVDRLLSRKQYGEHMARYWLDLVRFADTNGMHKDFYRNNVAYRDWVIRAFNADLGYDDFVKYQLAGDLYEKPSRDQLAASGFHRLHLIIDRGTALPEESFTKNVFDRVTSVGTAFMGMTVNCAMCHDHKYDPMTQEDFYSLFAFFNNIDAAPETRGRPRNGLQPPFVSMPSADQAKRLAEMNKEIDSLGKRIGELKKSTGLGKTMAEKAKAVKELKLAEQRRSGWVKQRDAFERSIPKAMVMKERKEVRPAYVLIRGEYDKPGKRVERGTPRFLPSLKKKGKVATRMELAEWFVDDRHPLTARVAVNRFWQQLFGVGLVKTSEDLGAQGEVPSHPELLDYLTVRFMAGGWKVKGLLKEMVMSRTYQQSSKVTASAYKKDPENRLLGRGSRYRMDAEVIRDQILATSGLMSRKMFGPSVKPPQPDGLWKAVTMIGERFRPDKGEAIYRRSVYTYWKRAMPPPQMTILNAPNRDACVSRRERTNTPAQALLLLNESEYLKAARRLAQVALEREGVDDGGRVAFMYEVVTSKLPDGRERGILLKLLGDLRKKYGGDVKLAGELVEGVKLESDKARVELAAWTMIGNTLYNLDITRTRD